MAEPIARNGWEMYCGTQADIIWANEDWQRRFLAFFKKHPVAFTGTATAPRFRGFTARFIKQLWPKEYFPATHRLYICFILWLRAGYPASMYAYSNERTTAETARQIMAEHPEVLAVFDLEINQLKQEQQTMNDNATFSVHGTLDGLVAKPFFETRSYLKGRDISAISDGELISEIKKIEKEIAELESIKTSSKRIVAYIDELKDHLAKIVEILDARVDLSFAKPGRI